MSDPRPDRLDAAIDEALARARGRAPDAGFRGRVMARLGERAARRGLRLAWGGVAAAAALTTLAILPREPTTVVPHPVAPPPPTVSTPARITAPAAPAPPRTETHRAPRRTERPLPEPSELDIARLDTPAIDIEPLARPEVRTIAPIESEPVVVAPLSFETAEPSPPEDTP